MEFSILWLKIVMAILSLCVCEKPEPIHPVKPEPTPMTQEELDLL